VKKILCALSLVLILTLTVPAPIYAAEPADVFYIEFQDTVYPVHYSQFAPKSAEVLFHSLCEGTAQDGEGNSFSIPGLAELFQDQMPMEFCLDSLSADVSSTLPLSAVLQLSADDVVELRAKALSSLSVKHEDGELFLSKLPGGKPVTYDSTVSDWKDALVLWGDDDSVIITGDQAVPLPNVTVAGIAFFRNGQELADDTTYHQLVQMAGGEENLANNPITVTWVEEEYQYVEISWSSMTADFVYDYGQWDSEQHVWQDSWHSPNDTNQSEIVIKNYSSYAVDYSVSFQSEEGFHISYDFKNAPPTGTLQKANDKASSEIPSATLAFTYWITSAPVEDLSVFYEKTAGIGRITVTISNSQ